ncbi:MAG: glycosyltransferase [Chloroflexota bacterium]
MRVLIAVHGYPPTFNGGAERRAARTARHLLARGFDVRVLCVESAQTSNPQLRWQDDIQGGVPVRRLYFGTPAGEDSFVWGYNHPLSGRAVHELIRDWRPSLLHLFGGYLLSSSVLQEVVANSLPAVVSLTDYWWLCQRITLSRRDGTCCPGPSPVDCSRCRAESFRRYRLPARAWPAGANAFWRLAPTLPAMARLLGVPAQERRARTLLQTLNSASILISPSAYLAEVYVRHGINPGRLRICRQGVDQESAVAHLPSPTLRVGYLGQVKEHKGVHLLVEAWSRLRGAGARSLALYGSDAGEEAYGRRLRRAIKRLDGVRWEGEFQGQEVWRVLANLDAVVVPSLWLENSPNSILEAQAAGVPVIGSNLGGIAELVRHEENGLLFAPNDAAALAMQLQRLLDEPDLLPRLRRAAMRVASVEEEITQLAAFYAQIANSCADPTSGKVAQQSVAVAYGLASGHRRE